MVANLAPSSWAIYAPWGDLAHHRRGTRWIDSRRTEDVTYASASRVNTGTACAYADAVHPFGHHGVAHKLITGVFTALPVGCEGCSSPWVRLTYLAGAARTSAMGVAGIGVHLWWRGSLCAIRYWSPFRVEAHKGCSGIAQLMRVGSACLAHHPTSGSYRLNKGLGAGLATIAAWLAFTLGLGRTEVGHAPLTPRSPRAPGGLVALVASIYLGVALACWSSLRLTWCSVACGGMSAPSGLGPNGLHLVVDWSWRSLRRWA